MADALRADDGDCGWLAEGIHAVRVGEDLVLLDLAADAYLCLPECGDLRIEGRRALGSMDDLLRLAAEELVHPTSAPDDRVPPPALRSARLPPAPPIRPTLRDLATFGVIWLDVVRRRPTLLDLSRRYARRRRRRSDPDALAARVEVFRQLLPLAPWTGACLLQAELLLRFLNAADLDADWVFGVRTFPFLAHCWLQIGEQCVSEAPETLTVYRPIMVI
ncbi:MAG: lasso peptide biosynthesis B2 protein [Brevundimonas sp.]|uniref:lasso peptide biosynthesis B2 protein n=1 Tax=unclassified Brevundimonas TaxID=2622653 RepID=UPI0025C60C9C|nr:MULTISPECIES: lasso peptide biosynthesis B2 protein [unclassified Brevundimonas]MCA0355443.1 lasso peptide biosynthesis B2 protein [Pseudomonadota bacterium]